MKYYLIVGEASGDLHASRLMQSLMQYDPEAEFRFFGGDLMAKVGGTRVKHYRELAYMGFVPVLLHLPTIFKNMKMCKEDIMRWKPDAVISPKIWAWKEWRIKAIKRDVKEMFSILPFEVAFYEKKHHYKIHYVGNPTAEEVDNFLHVYSESKDEFCQRNGLSSKPIIAILAGSRKQEIKDNLPSMLEAARHFEDYQMVVAAAPSITESYYKRFLENSEAKMVKTQTYELLAHATVALVTSGTATLETALLNVPQVVCYETPVPKLIRFAFKHIIKVRFISLVNLIADKEIVQELLADRFSIRNIANELYRILPGQPSRERMLADYQLVRERLGNEVAPDNAARIMVEKLTNRRVYDMSSKPENEFISEQNYE